MIYFIIPAFNEAQNLPALLRSIHAWAVARRQKTHLIVVDDGSTDATARIAGDFQALPVTVLQHPTNLGVHCVFQTGFRAVSGLRLSDQDVVVTLEADNTSSLEILDAMLGRAAGGFDLVLASCYAPGGRVIGVTPYRWVLSWCANLLLRSLPDLPRVHTFSSFYRVYRAPFFRRMVAAYGDRLIEEQGFVCVVETLLKCNILRPRICEVPLVLDGARRKGPSTMKTLRTIRGYLRLIWRALSGRLARPVLLPDGEVVSEAIQPMEVPGGR